MSSEEKALGGKERRRRVGRRSGGEIAGRRRRTKDGRGSSRVGRSLRKDYMKVIDCISCRFP